MEINFTTEPQSKQLTFSDVEENQFFVNDEEYLCQKIGDGEYIFIADSEGLPCTGHAKNVEENELIKRLLPRVTKINF